MEGPHDVTPTATALGLAGVATIERVLSRVLQVAGEQLGMDVAWVSELRGGNQRLRAVHGQAEPFGVRPGLEAPHEHSFCSRVISGALPSVIPDARADPRTRDLPITEQFGIGAYAGAPLRLADGSLYGMLCCVSSSAQHTLDDKDAKFLAILAQVAAEEIDRERARDAERQAREARLDQALTGECLSIVFQPIVDLRTMTITGAEALSRFTIPPQSPATWFADAARLGRTEDLELVAIREALTSLAALPANVYLSLNASPSTLLSGQLADLVTRDNGPRLQLEITEHSDVDVDDHDTLTAALQRLRAMGVRIALDDAGAGYAGLRQILLLKPDVIKLDLALVRDIDHDSARAALAGSLVDFAARVDSTLIAEGVETQAELDTLLELGIGSAQGYLLGRPAPLPLPAALAAPPPRD